MLKYLVVISGILVLFGCSSSSTDAKKNHATINVTDSALVTLSHVKAYLLIGNVKQAQKTFDTIDNSQAIPNTLLTLAELHAASGEAEGAQQAFLLALSNDQLDKKSVPVTLIDHFCSQKKWPALQGYADALVSDTPASHSKNSALNQIGLCFFDNQRWDDALLLLEELDDTKQVNPRTYLALAHVNVTGQQYAAAQELIGKYEAVKTKVTPNDLWATIEVYRALSQPEQVNKNGAHLRALFPNSEYTRKYIILTKREQRRARALSHKPEQKPDNFTPTHQYHVIKKGETLYQLSKTYDVFVSDLLKWNATLAADNIPLGAKIRVSK